jgi:hypothetical protein
VGGDEVDGDEVGVPPHRAIEWQRLRHRDDENEMFCRREMDLGCGSMVLFLYSSMQEVLR